MLWDFFKTAFFSDKKAFEINTFFTSKYISRRRRMTKIFLNFDETFFSNLIYAKTRFWGLSGAFLPPLVFVNVKCKPCLHLHMQNVNVKFLYQNARKIFSVNFLKFFSKCKCKLVYIYILHLLPRGDRPLLTHIRTIASKKIFTPWVTSCPKTIFM